MFIPTNVETNKTFLTRKVPEFMRKVLLESGLVEYYKNINNFHGSKVKTFIFLMALTIDSIFVDLNINHL